jgi:hypothetical protein
MNRVNLSDSLRTHTKLAIRTHHSTSSSRPSPSLSFSHTHTPSLIFLAIMSSSMQIRFWDHVKETGASQVNVKRSACTPYAVTSNDKLYNCSHSNPLFLIYTSSVRMCTCRLCQLCTCRYPPPPRPPPLYICSARLACRMPFALQCRNIGSV